MRQINYNMRCIEMELKEPLATITTKINYNMRCIEMEAIDKLKAAWRDKLQHEMY